MSLNIARIRAQFPAKLVAVGVRGIDRPPRRNFKIPHRNPHRVHIRPRGHEVPQPLNGLVAKERIAVRIIVAPNRAG